MNADAFFRYKRGSEVSKKEREFIYLRPTSSVYKAINTHLITTRSNEHPTSIRSFSDTLGSSGIIELQDYINLWQGLIERNLIRLCILYRDESGILQRHNISSQNTRKNFINTLLTYEFHDGGSVDTKYVARPQNFAEFSIKAYIDKPEGGIDIGVFEADTSSATFWDGAVDGLAEIFEIIIQSERPDLDLFLQCEELVHNISLLSKYCDGRYALIASNDVEALKHNTNLIEYISKIKRFILINIDFLTRANIGKRLNLSTVELSKVSMNFDQRSLRQFLSIQCTIIFQHLEELRLELEKAEKRSQDAWFGLYVYVAPLLSHIRKQVQQRSS